MIANAIDKAIGVFAPSWAAHRMAHRLRSERIGAALATYQAAKRDRTNRDYNPKDVSADAAIIPDLHRINASARDMVRDNDYAKSYNKYMKRAVVGPGMNPQPQVRKADGSLDQAASRLQRDVFYDWAMNKNAVDTERRCTFFAIQRWAISELSVVGECFLRICYKHNPGTVGISLQRIESEQLDRYKISGDGGREVRGGVEVDEFGAPVAYWIYPRHPNDIAGIARPSPILLESIRYPAEQILHVYDPERARQTRGVSPMVSSLRRMRDLSEYDRAQLLTARAEACLGFVIKTNSSGTTQPLGLDENGQPVPVDDDGNDPFAMQPLMVARLGTDEEIQSFIPTRPGGTYAPFVTAQLRAISAGLGTSYEQIARDFTTTNFSGLRQALAEDRREIEMSRTTLLESLLAPFWPEFILTAAIEGWLGMNPLITAGSKSNLTYATWRGPAYLGADPSKDIKATADSIALGIMTREEAALERGRDFYEVQDQLKKEAAYMTPQQPIQQPQPQGGA
jgi:lambda family phage portal protein